MQIKSLKLYCDIVHLHSFSKAAEENGVSQSSASQLVHQLEARLGAPLIDRSTRPFGLTPEGKKYYEGCRGIVRRYFDLEHEVRTLHEAVASRLTVASIYSVGLAHMSSYQREFQRQYPKANVRIDYFHPDRVYEAVETEEADLGLVSFPEKSRRLGAIPWRRERLALAVAPGHRLADRSAVTLEELDGEPMVAFQRGLRIREAIDRELSKRRLEAPIACEFDNVETIKRAVEIGEGFGLLPEPTVRREEAAGSLVSIPLAECDLERPLGIIFRRDHEMSETAERFVELLRAHADDLDAPAAQQPRQTVSVSP